ncbi:D-alanine--D-alanine ligase family protein [Buchananella hordeovulneris]|uniref:D-alanine--D-alanine ligase n=1 Tax=Buchananella hordeovulneris TaxID=52770 RepID=A0A1Q5PWT5_9ACTO|nr:D-alanine--D-alanine ligase family protein [Buchananella hordeovulneris]MDO5081255.1 D-alanine--D-alanine ligase family protein [Buchananella hordeovulneris]OKL52058.1 D-alanine--D-alanine ligase A [Buchananella hordeovulneris]RRD51851.1 D-alanine--D-alanine ligase [Buchananella hordeovulneris]
MGEQHNVQAERKPRVAVIFGGRSGEHGISCATAANVLAAVDRDRFEVVPIGITRDGQWVVAHDDPQLYELRAGQVAEILPAEHQVVATLGQGPASLLQLDRAGQRLAQLGEVDVVLPLLHGPFGEDGTLQGLCEMAGVRYVGCGVLSSAVAMDKHIAKLVLAGHGLPVGRSVGITDAQWRRDPAVCLDAVAALGLPVFVKPARAGSSLGISKVTHAGALRDAIEAAREHDPKVIVEAAVDGREIEVGVLQGRDGQRPRVSVPGEIVLHSDGFYDFSTKYVDGTAQMQVPAQLSEELVERLQELAARAFEALQCEGLARVDFFVRDNGDVVINEVNTLPGFTQFSMYPVMWQHSGVEYRELVTELLELALSRPVGLR